MTAPDLPTWTVADDPVGEPTLWHGDLAVLRLCDVKTGGELLGGESAEYRHLMFDLLTRVLAPDEATVERLAPKVHDAYLETSRRLGWQVQRKNAVTYFELSDDAQELDRATVRAVLNVLAALAGTSAQARHTADDAKDDCPSYREMTGGGEHG